MPKRAVDKRKPETIIRELRWKLKRATDSNAFHAQSARDGQRRAELAEKRVEGLEGMLEISQDLLKVSEQLRKDGRRAQ